MDSIIASAVADTSQQQELGGNASGVEPGSTAQRSTESAPEGSSTPGREKEACYHQRKQEQEQQHLEDTTAQTDPESSVFTESDGQLESQFEPADVAKVDPDRERWMRSLADADTRFDAYSQLYRHLTVF